MRLKNPLYTNRRLAAALAGAVLFGALANPAAAEEKVVKRAELIIREGKGSLYKPVVTLHRGDVVNVVGRDPTNARWLQVQVNGQTGWVYEDALEARNVTVAQGNRSGFGGSGASVGANAAASSSGFEGGLAPTELSIAGAGWDARQYAQKRSLNAAGLQAILNARQSITGPELEAFQSQGKVGSAGGR